MQDLSHCLSGPKVPTLPYIKQFFCECRTFPIILGKTKVAHIAHLEDICLSEAAVTWILN